MVLRVTSLDGRNFYIDFFLGPSPSMPPELPSAIPEDDNHPLAPLHILLDFE